MKKIISVTIASLLLLSVSSCALLKGFNRELPLTPDHLRKGTKADIQKFFNGDVDGFAITQDEYGNINGTELVKINGSWEDNKGVLRQTFYYRNGKKDARTWLVTVNPDKTFSAVGHDAAAPGRGVHAGNAIQMAYTLLLPENGMKVEVRYLDTFYFVSENSAIMISDFKKRGGQSGKTILSLKKNPSVLIEKED